MGVLDERVRDLFFDDQTAAGDPTEEGLMRLVGGQLRVMLGGVVESVVSAASDFIVRIVSSNLTIATGTTRIHRDTVINDGVEIVIEDGGELLVL